MATCMHCGAAIRHHRDEIWHSADEVFPQYCYVHEVAGSRLHEAAPQRGEYTIEEIVSLGDIGALR